MHCGPQQQRLQLIPSTDPISVRLSEFTMASTPSVHTFLVIEGMLSDSYLFSCYEDLGVIEDLSTFALIEIYKMQVDQNPQRAPIFLSALKAVGHLRGGEDQEFIASAVNEAYSSGRYDLEDIRKAYSYFGFRLNDPSLTEDSIIGKFYAFLSSINNDTDARLQLWRIGDSRRSERIKAASEDRVFLEPYCSET